MEDFKVKINWLLSDAEASLHQLQTDSFKTNVVKWSVEH